MPEKVAKVAVEGVSASKPLAGTDKLIVVGLYGAMGVFGITLCLLLLVKLRAAFRAPRHLLYVHLYLANLMILICSLVAAAAAYEGGWFLGADWCQAYATVCFVAGMAAIFFTALLAVEAYIAINWERTYNSLTAKHYHTLGLLGWLQALFWGLAPLNGWSSYSLEPVGLTCEISWLRKDPNHVTYLTTLIGFGFALPLSMAAFFLFLSWCSPAPTKEEADRGDTPMLCTWFQTSRNHQAVILKASTLQLGTSLLAWTPYAILCLLPFYYKNLSLPPLTILIPSLAAKSVLALQGLVLIFCSVDVRRVIYGGKTHRA